MTTTMKTSTHPAYLINPTHATHTLVGPSWWLGNAGDTITFTPRLGGDNGDLGWDYVKIFVSTSAPINLVLVWNTFLMWNTNSSSSKNWKLEKGLRVWSADDAREIWAAMIAEGWEVTT